MKHEHEHPAPRFKRGDKIRRRTRRDATGFVVEEPRRIASEWTYAVEINEYRENYLESDLESADLQEDIPSLLARNAWGSKQTLSKIVTYTKLKQPLQDLIYAYRASRTQFFAYQFKPLVKFLDSPNQRMLIADEVGLGKTIEAGYVLQELRARNPDALRRILIICPAHLRVKWREEMDRRFEEHFELLDSRGVRQLLADAQTQGESLRFQAICSMQTLRSSKDRALNRRKGKLVEDWEAGDEAGRPSLLDEFRAGCPPLDLVIVDEAHHMRNPDTRTHRLGTILGELADAVLLLTATPIHLGSQNLFHLLRILDPDEFASIETFNSRIRDNEHVISAERQLRLEFPPDFASVRTILQRVEATGESRHYKKHFLYGEILQKLDTLDSNDRADVIEIQRDLSQLNVLSHILVRTRKRDVQEYCPVRTAAIIRVDWTAEEADCYDALTTYCCTLYTSLTGQWAARMAVINLQRQMASCMPAMLEGYASGSNVQEIDTEEVEDVESVGEIDGTTSIIRQDPEFRELVSRWRNHLSVDSKLEAFVEQLTKLDKAEPGRKFLVFSFYRRTLEYLEHHLTGRGINCVVIHGGIPSTPLYPDTDERAKRVRSFHEDDKVRVLLSSEVGSEGLDFQTASHIVFNYDLPWNPMTVEQRIGRLDRLGQPSKRVLIFNFSIANTIEDEVLRRLYDRIRIFEETIGDLEPIIGQHIRELTGLLLSNTLTKDEKNAEIDKRASVLENLRREERELEEKSSRFVGHDQYFTDTLDRIGRCQRFVTRNELEVFVRDFLEREYPNCMWEETAADGVFLLPWKKELDDLVRRYRSPQERQWTGFLARAHGRQLRVTCDAERAYEREGIELLSLPHPLMFAIRKYYDDHADRLGPIAAVEVNDSVIPPNDYLYFLYLLQVHGARRGRYIEPVFVSPDCEILEDEDSERLLNSMVQTGADLHASHLIIPPEQVQSLSARADTELLDRRARRIDRLRRTNDAIIENRLHSLGATYDAKKGKIAELLGRAQAKKAAPRYIRMLEGRLRNMEADYTAKIRDIEEGRQVDVGWHLFAAGVVRTA